MIILAITLLSEHSFDEAVVLMRQVLERTTRSFGGEHSLTQTCIALLASIKLEQDLNQKLTSLRTSAVETIETSASHDDPESPILSSLLQNSPTCDLMMQKKDSDAGDTIDKIEDTEA